MDALKITLIGGPTALIEIAGFRFVADPTFDEPGEHKLPARHSDQDVTARSFAEATRFCRRDVTWP